MTTLTELGEMLIEMDQGRIIEFFDGDHWLEIREDDFAIANFLSLRPRLKPVPVKTYYRAFSDCGALDLYKSDTPWIEVDRWLKAMNATHGREVTHIYDFEI